MSPKVKTSVIATGCWQNREGEFLCRWFYAWKEMGEGRIAGIFHGYAGGGCYAFDEFYARFDGDKLAAILHGESEQLSDDEYEIYSLLDSQDILRIEQECWSFSQEWNCEIADSFSSYLRVERLHELRREDGDDEMVYLDPEPLDPNWCRAAAMGPHMGCNDWPIWGNSEGGDDEADKEREINRERLMADGDLNVVLSAFSQESSTAECGSRLAPRAFLRLVQSPDAKIRARAAALPYLLDARRTWSKLLHDDDLRVVRAVLTNDSLSHELSRHHILKIAKRSDAHAEAVAKGWDKFKDSKQIVGKPLDYLVGHASKKVRLLMAQQEPSDIAESALQRLATDPVAAVARRPKATLAARRALRRLLESGDAEKILSVLSTIEDLDEAGGRPLAEAAFSSLVGSSDASVRAKAAESPAIIFFKDCWESFLSDSDTHVVESLLSNADLWGVPANLLLKAAKRADAMAIRVAQAYGKCAEGSEEGNKLVKYLLKHKSVDVRRALAETDAFLLPRKAWQALAKDEDAEIVEKAEVALAELDAEDD